MKYLMSLFFVCLSAATFAQFELGPRVGLGTVFTDVQNTSENIKSGDASYGFSLGLFTRFGSERFKVMPEVLYSSTSANINFKDGSGVDQVSETKLDKIDVPVNLVVKAGSVVAIQGGVIGSYLINSEDSFKDSFNDAVRNYEDFTFGYQAGLGFDLGNLLLDIRYEGPISDVSKSVENSPIQFDERQSMVKASLGFNLFK